MRHLAYIIACFVLFINIQLVNAQGDVKIGNQTWMSKNLDVNTFRNGEAIPEAKNAKQWIKASKNKKAAFCYYEYRSKNGAIYGKLYNWFAVNDPRGLAPKGYHVASSAEWTVLTDFLGGEYVAGEKLKSTSGWANGGNGDNSSGFNGLPGGYCYASGNFSDVTAQGYFWSSSGSDTRFAWSRGLITNKTEVDRYSCSKYDGLSVRCLRD